jgi:hypothetical protein
MTVNMFAANVSARKRGGITAAPVFLCLLMFCLAAPSAVPPRKAEEVIIPTEPRFS